MTEGDRLKNLLLMHRNIVWQHQLESYTNASLQKIQKALNIARDDLLHQVDMTDFRIPPGREHAMLDSLNDMTFGIQAQLTGDIQGAASVAGEKSYREYGNILSFNGQIPDSMFNLTALSPDQLRAMVNMPVGGELMSKWVADSFSSNIVDGIHTAIMAETLKGAATPKIVDRLVDAFGLIQRDAETLVRTSIASVNNQAAKAVYDQNKDIIKYEVWSSTLEVGSSGKSTCLACACLDGRKFKIDEDHIRPPLHHKCRCFMVSETLSYRELGLDVDEMKKSLRPFSERDDLRKIVTAGQYDGDFETFFKSRSVMYQKELLGPNRYKMLKAGEIKWDDLVDVNGEIVLLKRGTQGGYTGLVSSQKYKSPVVKVAKVKPKPIPKKSTVKEMPGSKDIDAAIAKHYDSKQWKDYDKKILAAKNKTIDMEKKSDAFYLLHKDKIRAETSNGVHSVEWHRLHDEAEKGGRSFHRLKENQIKSLNKAVSTAVAPPKGGDLNIRTWSPDYSLSKIKKLENNVIAKCKSKAEGMLHPDIIKQMPEVKLYYKRGRAGYDQSQKVIKMGKVSSSTFIHEYGHAVEHNIPGLQAKANEFLKKRAGNEPLSKMFPNNPKYSKELGWKDKFFNHYCGKQYKTGSTEIISMGMEEMYKNPHTFFKQDPEYFNFIKGIMWGKP